MIREVSEAYSIDKADKAHDNQRSFNLLDNLNIDLICIHAVASSTDRKPCSWNV